MKIGFVGLGSIGKRHFRNIGIVLDKMRLDYEIDAMRSTEKKLPEEVEKLISGQYHSTEEMPDDYDVIFVTNPTVLHYETVQNLIPKTRYMFIEKPVFDHYQADIETLGIQDPEKYYVACPMRFTPVMQYLKEHIASEKIFSVRAISSSYLPEWRTGIDYRQNYSAHKEMGGGVTLDLIHEIDYITSLFGLPMEVFHKKGKYSDLEINSDDLSVYLLDYGDKLVEIHLDYFGRKKERRIELYCNDYVIQGDFLENKLFYCGPDTRREVVLPQDEDYLMEMEYFVNLVMGREKNRNNIVYANEILKIAQAF